MTNTIFFSWQADTDKKSCRNLQERALERAVEDIGDDTNIDKAVRELAVDRDTRNVAGAPPIVDTIFRKIDAASVFVPDLTFVGKRFDGRPTPNPNVLVEYGWALKSLTHSRIVPIMNTFYGLPTAENMPFDMRHLRNPIQYDCAPDADEETVKRIKSELGKALESAIRTVLLSDEYRASLPQPKSPPRFNARRSEGTPGRFKARGVPIGVSVENFLGRETRDITLTGDPVMWLRVMPSSAPDRLWRVPELQKVATKPTLSLHPLSRGWTSYDYLRSSDGFGIYPPIPNDPATTPAVVFTFTNGEVWGCDAYLLAAMARDGRNVIPLSEGHYAECLDEYSAFLVKLGLTPPFQWVAGMENLRGRGIIIHPRRGYIQVTPGPRGKCLDEVIVEEGSFSPGMSAHQALKPFFTKLFDSCGVERPDWLDEGNSPTVDN